MLYIKKSLIALSFGTLGLGIAEFIIIGVLPYIAIDFNITIPTAGHLISAYASGVCVGAPFLIFVRRYPLKNILLALILIIMLGNLMASFAFDYNVMILARFISGLPHGAYFGVGSIIAEKLSDKGKSTQAISIMIAGMTVANLFGVPLGTFLSLTLSWRVGFLLVVIWGIITFFYVWKWVPQVKNIPDTGLKGQFYFLKKLAPWLLIISTILGNGAVFCWYSYIIPLLTSVSGFSPHSATLLIVLAGVGMVIGNLSGGVLSDRFMPVRVAIFIQGFLSIVLVCIFFLSHIPYASILLMTLGTACLFAFSSPQQLLLLKFSKGGELLGTSSAQVAFNLGNAIGAYCGGLPVQAGLGYQYSALVGTPFALLGFFILYFFYKKFVRVKTTISN